MPSRFLVRNDTAPPAAATLKTAGKAVDIASATIRYILTNSADEVVVSAAANNDQAGDGSDGSKGKVSYDWVVADTAKAGTFTEEWEVTFSDGTVRTFPTKTTNLVHIRADRA